MRSSDLRAARNRYVATVTRPKPGGLWRRPGQILSSYAGPIAVSKVGNAVALQPGFSPSSPLLLGASLTLIFR